MKTIRYMITAATISAALLFAGCNKENSPENGLTGTANETASGAANVTYELQTLLPPTGGLIKWNTGYITASEIIFNGVDYNGEMLRQQQYETNTGKTWNLFYNNSDLGVISVPYSMFSSGSSTIQLSPLNGNNPLFLSGTFSTISSTAAGRGIAVPFQQTPVEVLISQPIILSSIWVNNVTINSPGYVAMLSLDLGQFTTGIDANMLESAQLTNGILLITSASNQNLYGIIVNNLQKNMLNLTLSTQVMTATTVNTPGTVYPAVE